MLFTSYGFIAFIAILFILYYLIPKRFQWLLLLCADVVFYACAGWQGPCFMAVTVLVSWASTNLMGASLRRQKETLSSPESKALPREERRAIKKAAEKSFNLDVLANDLYNLATKDDKNENLMLTV